ncbi:MAG: hypothetical protein Kow0063_09080 [Anaerolineae bacterium]
MAALHQLRPTIHFEIFTQVPPWFFQDSLAGPFGYHSLLTDIGLAQRTSLREDLPETLRRLDRFLPFDTTQIREIASQVRQLGCQLLVCDIAPMGVAVARQAGIPSVLVENFTWDWIYEGYAAHAPELRRHIAYLSEWFEAADYHVQTVPVCRPGPADLTTSPVSRKIRSSPGQIRRQLGLPEQAKVVMITMGGIPWRYEFLEQLSHQNGVYFVIAGAEQKPLASHPHPSNAGSPVTRGGLDRLVLLPHRSRFFHPDLVNACDVVIGKAGYSTVAEVYYAGVPFGYVGRARFRETDALAAFIEQQMHGLPITEEQFQNGDWLASLAHLLAQPRTRPETPHGADQIASFICELLDRQA